VQTQCTSLMQYPSRLTYKIAEAAQLLGLSPITIRRAIARGLIKPIRAFRTPLISAVELERFVASSGQPSSPKSHRP